MKQIFKLSLIALLLMFSACSDDNDAISDENKDDQKEEEIVSKDISKILNDFNQELKEIKTPDGFSNVENSAAQSASIIVEGTQALATSFSGFFNIPDNKTQVQAANKETNTWVIGDITIKSIIMEMTDKYTFDYTVESSGSDGPPVGKLITGWISKKNDASEMRFFDGGKQTVLVKWNTDGNNTTLDVETEEQRTAINYNETTGSIKLYSPQQLIEEYTWTANGAKGVYKNFETVETIVW